MATKLTADARRSARERGKSDAIDAIAIARAALREGLDTLPVARLAGRELDVRLLVDHRERLVGQRTALINGPRWHVHDRWPEFEIPPRALTTTRFDEVVQPVDGPHPTSALRGTSNLVVQDVCPGRRTGHASLAVDSVSFAALLDAIGHQGVGAGRPAAGQRVREAVRYRPARAEGARRHRGVDDRGPRNLAAAPTLAAEPAVHLRRS